MTIESLNKERCTGCGSCFNICNRNAISMRENEEGFLYPVIEVEKCTECGQCASHCPEINSEHTDEYQKDPEECYAMMADSDLRKVSSSGGMFSVLANFVLEKDGYVCGASFSDDYMSVEHIIIHDKELLYKLRGSKYVQSNLKQTYRQLETYLKDGCWVLFSGTPCQVSGFRSYLKKDYNKLILVDIVCHGVPSPSIYNKYLLEISEGKKINKVDFREKDYWGWGTALSVFFEDDSVYRKDYSDAYMAAFLKGISDRECCGTCRYANPKRIGDFSIGDFWGVAQIDNTCDDNGGTSLVLINNKKAKKIFKQLQSQYILAKKIEINSCLKLAETKNGWLLNPVPSHWARSRFFELCETKTVAEALDWSVNSKYDVGIVGWWYNENYGGTLTYFALHQILQIMGLSVLMVAKCSRDKNYKPKYDSVPYRFAMKNYHISKNYTPDTIDTLNSHCKTFISGSDQLFNPTLWAYSGPEYFLDFVSEGNNRVSYASSFGNGFSDPKKLKNRMSEWLHRFNSISVRENYGVDICEDVFGLKAKKVLDPVFLCDVEEYKKQAMKSGKAKTERYLLSFFLDPNDEKRDVILYVAEKLNLKYINLLNATNFKKNMEALSLDNTKPNIDIEEFLFYYMNADFVITDSFHGTCFSIIFRKNFISIANYKRGEKRFISLLDSVGLSHQLVDNLADVKMNEKLFDDINYEKVYEKLQPQIEESYKWLENAIKHPNKPGLNIINKSNSEDAQLNNKTKIEEKMIADLHENSDFRKIKILVTLLRDYGVKHIVLSPGGRDVPIIRMFENNEKYFILHRVTDERSAAYYGMGIAAQLRQPVACVCTSGTAVSNYLPAVTEAYYTGIPLILISADRKEIYLNQGEDQTIPQKNIFKDVIRKEISIPEASGSQAEYQTQRDISDCILETIHNGYGPVHINITIEKIGIGKAVAKNEWEIGERIHPHILRVGFNSGEKRMMDWVKELVKSQRILIVYGQNPSLSHEEKSNIELFASKYNCVILTDHISNLNCAYSLKAYNMLLSISQDEFNRELSPDILISVGGKRLMNDPLTFKVRGGKKNIRHWSVTPDGKMKDFYFRLTSILEMSQSSFFSWFAQNAGDIHNNGVYYSNWIKQNKKYSAPPVKNFNAFYIQRELFSLIPPNSILHLGVGQSFYDSRRYEIDDSVEVFCNMGTNGIDGCTSTFMGQCSVVKDRLCFLLVGDLSFFYDMNSIWNKPLNSNIRILLVNNNGTDLLRGHRLKAVTSAHNTKAEGWVKSNGFEYLFAATKEEFDEKLSRFVSDKAEKALFFEVVCE